MNKIIIYSLTLLFVVVALGLIRAPSAHAQTSPPIANTPQLSLINPSNGTNRSVDENWLEEIENATDNGNQPLCETAISILQTIRTSDTVKFHVTQDLGNEFSGGIGSTMIFVHFTQETSSSLTYNYSTGNPDNGSFLSSRINSPQNLYTISLQPRNNNSSWRNCQLNTHNIPTADNSLGSSGHTTDFGSPPNWVARPLFDSYVLYKTTYVYRTNFPLEYYNYQTSSVTPNPGFPPLVPTPPQVSNFTPLMHVQFATNWKATFVDSRFTTVDGVPFLCSGEFAPNLHFEIFDITDGEELLITGSYSASAVYEYQFTKQPLQQEFRIVAWYSCPDGDITFTESSSRDFLIDGSGNLLRRGLNTCINETYPFLIWEDCMFAMNEIASTLMFNFHNPKNTAIDTVATQNPNNCHVLTTLDAWIYTPNQVVCPAVPKHVRDAVTPFVLFVLASIVFMYISRAKASVIS